MFNPTELILILLIVVFVFGAKRIPEIMGGLGKGIKTFKTAMDGEDESQTATPQVTTTPPTPGAEPPKPQASATTHVQPASTTPDNKPIEPK